MKKPMKAKVMKKTSDKMPKGMMMANSKMKKAKC